MTSNNMIDNGFNICLYRGDVNKFSIWPLERPRPGRWAGLLWESRHSLRDKVPYLLRHNETLGKFLLLRNSCFHLAPDTCMMLRPLFTQHFNNREPLLGPFLILGFWKWLVRLAGGFLLNSFGFWAIFYACYFLNRFVDLFNGTEYMSPPIH